MDNNLPNEVLAVLEKHGGWRGALNTLALAESYRKDAERMRAAGLRVTAAFRALGNARGIADDYGAKVECESAMLALDDALSETANG